VFQVVEAVQEGFRLGERVIRLEEDKKNP